MIFVIEDVLILPVATVSLIAAEPPGVQKLPPGRGEILVERSDLFGQIHLCLGLQVPRCVFANGEDIWIGRVCF